MTVDNLRLLELIVLRARDKFVSPSGSRYTIEYKILDALAKEIDKVAIERKDEK